jgi:hypothetical protein
MFSSRIPAICVLVSSLVIPAGTGEVSGVFTAGKRAPIRPKYAEAFDARDPRDARKHVVEVILSEAPVDIASAVADLAPHTNLINQDALSGRNYILLWVRQDGDVSMNATYSEKMTQFADTTTLSLKADMSSNTPDKVAGRIFTVKPVKTMDGEIYSVNLTFSAAVTRAPAATALPADGGEAGKAFAALLAAVSKKSWEGIARTVTEKNLKSFTDSDRTAKENLAGALETLGFWLPKKAAKITGGQLRGESAVLEVEGEVFEGQKALFLVRMVKTGSRWLFDRATNAGLIG